MTRRLLVSALPGELRAAWLDDNTLVDLLVLRDDQPWLTGNVYLARVAAVERPKNAAFLDLGLALAGYLPLEEAPGPLSPGQTLVVRVIREAREEKGPRLTARLGADAATLAHRARDLRAPALLRRAADPFEAALGTKAVLDELVVDDAQTYARARQVFAEAPALAAGLRLESGPESLFEAAGLEEQIDALLVPEVALPGGGRLLVEPVRTLTAIDVDSARHRGGGAAAALEVDLEAAAAIPRQLRLRGLSGLIVVDFLELPERGARRRVVAALRAGLRAPAPATRVYPMAASGLVEMTRRCDRPALHEVLTLPCGPGGSGRLKSAATRAFEALRALAREAAHNPARRPRLLAAEAVAAALAGPAAEALRALEKRLGRPIEVIPVPARSLWDDPFGVVLE